MESKKLEQYREKAKQRLDEIDSEIYELERKSEKLERERKNILEGIDKLEDYSEIIYFIEMLDSLIVEEEKIDAIL